MKTERAFEIGRLEFLWLELTTKCNLNCDHCYADANMGQPLTKELSLEDWKGILKQASDIRCRKVQFIGGEPTLYPNLTVLIETARSLGFDQIELFTNGTMVNNKIKRCLMRHKVSLAFSIYADCAEIHDSITRRTGSFRKTVDFIIWAVNSGFPVRAAIIKMEKNMAYIERTRQMLFQMGVKSIGIDRIRGVGRGCREKPMKTSIRELCGRCWMGRLCVTSSGEIFPCVFSRFFPVGHIREGLTDVIEGTLLQSFRQKLKSLHPKRKQISGRCDPSLCQPDVPPIPCDPEIPPIPCQPEVPPVPEHIGLPHNLW
jgi:MoaA/NifB/PqqE/SkfB family radical SAM enzyme